MISARAVNTDDDGGDGKIQSRDQHEDAKSTGIDFCPDSVASV